MTLSQTVPTYTTERDEHDGAVFLDANESYRQWAQINFNEMPPLNRYPDNNCRALCNALSESYTTMFKPSEILISSGSMELIDVLLRGLCEKGLLLNEPTYQVYETKAQQLGLKVEKVTMNKDFTLNIDGLRKCAPFSDVLLLINPNNPTGSLISKANLEQILSFFEGTVIIDEAYIEFAGLKHSLESFVLTHQNVIVIRSFSKAWGLAGVRLGYALGHQFLINKLSGLKSPYSVSVVAQNIGIQALSQQDKLSEYIYECLMFKRKLLSDLKSRGIHAIDTSANFILIKVASSHLLHEHHMQNVH